MPDDIVNDEVEETTDHTEAELADGIFGDAAKAEAEAAAAEAAKAEAGDDATDEQKAEKKVEEDAKVAADAEEAEKVAAMTSAERADYYKAKAEEEAKAAEEDGEKKEREGAPEEYADFTTPEGFEELDKERLDKFLPIVKKMDISQADTQTLIDHFAKEQTALIEDQVKVWEDTKAGWLKSSKEDKEFGGNDFDENVGKANKAIDAFGSDSLREALTQSGMGSHPEVIRVFVRIGDAISEGTIITDGLGSATQDKTAGEIMYPSMNK